MKKLLPAFLIWITLTSAATGQQLSREYGVVGKDDIGYSGFPGDEDAEAVVLFDEGISYFLRRDYEFDVIFERTTRIKVLKESGVKWAEVEVPFYQENGIYERVYDISGTTWNFENGRLTKTEFEPKNVYESVINESWKTIRFAMPDVKPGSIIEYKYAISSQYKFNLRDWEFQWRIPVVYSKYEVDMIPFYEYTFLLQGAGRFDYQKSYVKKGSGRQYGQISYQDMVHEYAMEDVPAFNDEGFITSINDYILKLDFQLSKVIRTNGTEIGIITTWEELNKELLKDSDFGKYIKKSEKMATKVIGEKLMEGKSKREKFDIIMDYVKQNYNWNGMNGKYASKSPKDLVDEKVGNCADLNLFALGLMNEYGIEAQPVILSTRNHGKVHKDYPYSSFFNYVLITANLDDRNVLADATEVMSLNDRIPVRCINDRGLIVKDGEPKWVNLGCDFPSSISNKITITADANHKMTAKVNRSATEYDALEWRQDPGDDKADICETFGDENFEIKEATVSIENLIVKNKPFVLNYEVDANSESIGDKIYVGPFLNLEIDNSPLKQKERTYPIDLIYPKQRSYESVVMIPDGYRIDFVPENNEISNDYFDLNYTVATQDDRLVVTFDYYFKQAVYNAKDYSKMKYFFNQIAKKGNEKIVFARNE